MSINVTPGEYRTARTFFEMIWGDRYDWDSEHMAKTPERFVKMLKELTTPEEFDFTKFRSTSDEMIVLGPIHFSSLCAHHIIPFVGEAWVGYVPTKWIVGLSKIPRLVKSYAKTLTVQEQLTADIGRRLDAELEPMGAAVVMRAEHMCMTLRGVQEHDTVTTTSYMSGVFADHSRTAKAELMSFINGGK